MQIKLGQKQVISPLRPSKLMWPHLVWSTNLTCAVRPINGSTSHSLRFIVSLHVPLAVLTTCKNTKNADVNKKTFSPDRLQSCYKIVLDYPLLTSLIFSAPRNVGKNAMVLQACKCWQASWSMQASTLKSLPCLGCLSHKQLPRVSCT